MSRSVTAATTQYWWRLNSRRGKTTCPRCRRRRKMVRYESVFAPHELADDRYGVCDRVFNCGYAEYPKHKPQGTPAQNREEEVPPPDPISYTRPTVMTASINSHEHNLYDYCSQKFGAVVTAQVFRDYLVGLGRRWPHSTTFWLKDTQGLIRGGFTTLYDALTGKAVKEPFRHSGWEHGKGYHCSQCLYGEHLLARWPDKKVAVVEAPKTAVICAQRFPDRLWIATNGLMTFQPYRMEPLRGRDVIIYQDREPLEFRQENRYLEHYWDRQARAMRDMFKSLEVFRGLDGEPEGTDLADII